jgi:hypothetical protein
MTNRDLLEVIDSWREDWSNEIQWKQTLNESYLKMFMELASEHQGIKREMGRLAKRLQMLEDIAREKEELAEEWMEENDRGEGTLTGRREVWRNEMEEQEEIDMELSDDEDAEGTEDDTEEEMVGKGKGKVTEKRMEGDENTLT